MSQFSVEKEGKSENMVEAENVADVLVKHQYTVPRKCIFSAKDIESFKKSTAFNDICGFIQNCADSIVGLKHTDVKVEDAPDCIQKVQTFMNKLFNLVDEYPPIQQPMRFGNKAYRQWHARMCTEVPLFLHTLLPQEAIDAGAIDEISPYLSSSFGDSTRIDFGTGHEMNMAVFLMCLYKVNLISTRDFSAAILVGFMSYIRAMRRLQLAYFLEPAGSHGVWGLDDYHCLTFVWGAAQLFNHPDIKTSSVLDYLVLEQNAAEYMYIECIYFIRKVKATAPFAETSPMLNDIALIDDWSKVCNGLMRLFTREVLGKVPVMQHLYFGTLLKCSWEPDSSIASTKVYQDVMSGVATVRP